jgi:hypothetical protein
MCRLPGTYTCQDCDILPILTANRYLVGSTAIIADSCTNGLKLKAHLQADLTSSRHSGLTISDAFFNTDSAFNLQGARRVCFSYGVLPNTAENKRNGKLPIGNANACSVPKPGRHLRLH